MSAKSPRPAYMMSEDEEKRIFLQGLRLFNEERDYFEAHETWEDVWHISSGNRRKFYQGIIQIAVTIVHLQRENRLGAERLRESAYKRFDGLPDMFMGVNIKSLLAQYDQLVLPAINKQDTPSPLLAPERLFTIDLLYDPFDDPGPADLE
jgi:predicted metal-dependent hydrolase